MRWPVLKSVVADGIPAFLQLVVVAFLVYLFRRLGVFVGGCTLDAATASASARVSTRSRRHDPPLSMSVLH